MMKDPLHNYMKVGIVQFMAYPSIQKGEGPVLEAISQIINDEFFGAIEITTVKDPQVRSRVAAALAVGGQVVGYGAQPQQLGNNCDLNTLDEKVRMASIQQVKAYVDEAIELGASRLAILSGKDLPESDRPAGMAALTASLEDICAYAKSKGDLAITLEVFDRTIDKKCLVGSTEEAVAISKNLRRKYPDFGLMIDLSHLPMQGETSQHSLSVGKDHIVHIHVGNCILDKSHAAYGDSHPRFGHPAGVNGVSEVREFLRVLLDIDYIGPGKQNIVAFEVKPQPGETSEGVVANAKRTLIEAWATL
jgi:sugar phosphate isomerase/epimerase